MTIDRLNEILQDWRDWMQRSGSKLGYPSKSIGIVSGGASSHDAFSEMLEASDYNTVRAIDAIISSLPKEQAQAINARWLDSLKPNNYAIVLDMAYDNLLTMAERRGVV